MFPKSLKLISVLCAGLAASATYASDGTISFAGSIVANTCSVAGNGGTTKNFTVLLPTVNASSFNDEFGSTSGTTPFYLNITGCSGATASVSAFFEAGSSIDLATGHLKNTAEISGAKNVQIALLNDKYEKMDLNGSSASAQKSTEKIITGDGVRLQYAAAYVKTDAAPVGVGAVTSSVVYTLVYP